MLRNSKCPCISHFKTKLTEILYINYNNMQQQHFNNNNNMNNNSNYNSSHNNNMGEGHYFSSWNNINQNSYTPVGNMNTQMSMFHSEEPNISIATTELGLGYENQIPEPGPIVQSEEILFYHSLDQEVDIEYYSTAKYKDLNVHREDSEYSLCLAQLEEYQEEMVITERNGNY